MAQSACYTIYLLLLVLVDKFFMSMQVSELETALTAARTGPSCEPESTVAHSLADNLASGDSAGGSASDVVVASRECEIRAAPEEIATQPDSAQEQLEGGSAPVVPDVQPALLDIMETAWHGQPAPAQPQVRG